MGSSSSANRRADEAERRAEEAGRRADEAGRAAEQVKILAQDNLNAKNLAEQKERLMETARDEATRRADEAQKRADENAAAWKFADQRVQEAHTARDEAGRQATHEKGRADAEGAARKQAEVRESEAKRAKEEAVLAATLSARAAAEAAQAQKAAEYAAAEAEKAQREADEARKAAEERLLRGIPPDMRPTPEQMQEFRARHGYGKHALNIAITGESGVGKSALLNALRGLWSDDDGAAAVGVNETTAVVEGYTDARHPHIKWYDVPGANTPTISGWMYFMDQSLYIFDALVVVFSDRFSQTAGTLLHNAHRCNIPAFLVRTKADHLIKNLKKDRRKQRLEDGQARDILRAETQAMVNDNLAKLNLPTQQVYLVSEDGLREWVTEGNASVTIDEPAIFAHLMTQPQPGS